MLFISISYVHIVSTVWAGKLCTLVFFYISKTPSAFHCDGPAFVIRRETGSSWRIRLRYIGQPIPSFIALVPQWFAPYQFVQDGSFQLFNCLSFTVVWRMPLNLQLWWCFFPPRNAYCLIRAAANNNKRDQHMSPRRIALLKTVVAFRPSL
jgi:hypothetical protein